MLSLRPCLTFVIQPYVWTKHTFRSVKGRLSTALFRSHSTLDCESLVAFGNMMTTTSFSLVDSIKQPLYLHWYSNNMIGQATWTFINIVSDSVRVWNNWPNASNLELVVSIFNSNFFNDYNNAKMTIDSVYMVHASCGTMRGHTKYKSTSSSPHRKRWRYFS